MHDIGLVQRRGHCVHLPGVYENLYVLADLVLLIDDAKAQTGIIPVQVAQRLVKRRPTSLDLTPVIRVAAQVRR
jgi:hypothetical protein